MLLIAYACEPDKGSEPAVGWNIALQLVQTYEVWVVTRENNRHAIEQALHDRPVPYLHFVFFDFPRWLRIWKSGQRGIRLYYFLWLFASWLIAVRLDRSRRFHIIHHLTLSVCLVPNIIACFRENVVWGPIGGVESFPRIFLRDARPSVYAREMIRRILHNVARYNPLLRITLRKTALVYVQTEATARFLGLGTGRVQTLPSVGLRASELWKRTVRPPEADGSIRVISVGRLEFIKGYHLSLKAFQKLLSVVPEAEYLIVGSGPEADSLKRLAQALGIQSRVRFLGSVPRIQVLQLLSSADMYIHPSLRDPPVFTLLEAMAVGVPVVCLANGGPAIQTTDATAVRVPLLNPEATVELFYQGMVRVVLDSDLRHRLIERALADLRQRFTWENKMQVLNEGYERVINESSART